MRLLEIPCEIMCRPKKLSKDESKALDEIPQPGPGLVEVKEEVVDVKEEEEESESEDKVERLKRKARDLEDRLKKVRSGSGRTCFFTRLLF